MNGYRFALLASVIVVTIAVADDSRNQTSCLQRTSLKLSNGKLLVVTFEDAQRIRAAARDYLAQEASKRKESLPLPEAPVIDCDGTVRMGAWILQPALSDPELVLSFLQAMTQFARVSQQIRFKRVGGKWKALSMGQVIFHVWPLEGQQR